MIEYTKDIVMKMCNDPLLLGVLAILSIVISIVGIITAFRGRRLSYRRLDFPFLKASFGSDALKKVFVEPIGQIAGVEFAIWNSGRKYINCSDMARKEPLRIVALNGSKILQGELSYSSCEYCDVNCIINENQKEILIDFDYLECEEGCIVNVVYEGNKEDIKVLGVIRGKKQIEDSQSVMECFKRNKIIYKVLTSKAFSWIVIFFCYFMCPVAFLQSGNFWAIENNFFDIPNTLGGRIVDFIVMGLLILFSIGVSIPFAMRLFKPRFPKDLESHFGK